MQQPKDILKQYWGYDAFRPLQQDIIDAALNGKDALALLPTGGGKSICFQVPALCMEGICLVVSPLIALMKDQVQNLKKRGIAAEAIYSGMHRNEIDRILDNCIYGGTKLLYLSPERLANETAIARIRKMKVNLLAVDEAHCISQWGYDFRPSYLKIAELREVLGEVPVLALTATATKEVVADIQEKLEFKNGQVFSKSFVRGNLAYVVLQEENKLKKLLDIVKKVPGTGIVYVRNRRGTEEIARVLTNNGIRASFYHAGLPSGVRSARQEEWINGKVRVMACTNAFGMGIDKPDVRSVVHMDLPDSLEAYFQEAGRAGRDGKKSYAVLLYAPKDKAVLERNVELSFPPMKEVRQVYRALGSYFQLATGSSAGRPFDFDLLDFCKNFKLDVLKTFSCLKLLEREDWLVMTEAVYIPSTFKVLVNREQLYDFQLKNKNLDLVIKTLLRVTEGAFRNYAKINENAIARFLKMPTDKLLLALHQLHKESIISYRPSKDKPQLIFTQERVSADNLTIDMKRYNFLKERYQKRIQKAIAYATTPRCRSQQLLAYFAEKSAPCGVCDVCLGRSKSQLSKDDFERYKSKIKMLLKREKLTEAELLESFSANRHANVLHALTYLLDEGFVEHEKEKLIWKNI
ncbi:MAG TPA: RecQ family ATP-dependent DNA helicase [Bacteroidetes bacterium]|nr:RecQ family ATP-dependent DNA helicase [Bacteroidota bacterium]